MRFHCTYRHTEVKLIFVYVFYNSVCIIDFVVSVCILYSSLIFIMSVSDHCI